MDRFVKYALIVMVAIVLVMLASAYIGYKVGGNSATDDKVNDAAGGNGDTYYNPFTIEHWGVHGEYVGFFSAGCAGGFVVGYIFPTVFKSNILPRRKI
ncbi:MAG: hypothetical protein ABR909_11240 [Candidatus Bathyarchaeia archaeon]|jgi:hypothetical protein